MARPKNDGLGYFPLDTDFFTADRRIQRLAAQFGADGPLFYIYILARAYKNGYYVEYDRDFAEDAALDLHCSEEKIGLMLHYLLNKSLLDRTLFDTVKVLSSHGIQTQYQNIVKSRKRDVEVDETLWILDPSETEGFIQVRQFSNKSEKKTINSGETPINPEFTPKSKGKEKESKINSFSLSGECEGEKAKKSGDPFTPEFYQRQLAMAKRVGWNNGTVQNIVKSARARGYNVDPETFEVTDGNETK